MTEHEDADEIRHIGIKRRSGRYPWGSGKDPFQRSQEFKSFVAELKSKGLTDTEIAKHVEALGKKSDPYFKFSTTDLRAATAISTEEIYRNNVNEAVRLRKTRQMGASKIAQVMGTSESTVRGWLSSSEQLKENSLRATAEAIKAEAASKPYLDVSTGNHLYVGVTKTKFNTALAILEDEGYQIHNIKVPQLGTDKQTNTKVLVGPDVSWSQTRKAVVDDGLLQVMTTQSDDGGITFRKPKDLPVMMSSKKIEVRYDEDGGSKMDGVIELRRGKEELSLGDNRYAQVRIAVDGTHFMKGMAIYADDLPDGVDIRFNSNKKSTDPKILAEGKLGAMKPLKVNKDTGEVDPANPFGSSTYPQMYTDKNGKTKQSVLNIVGTEGRGNVEGRWDQWSRTLSSQMLSKQPIALASQQLGLARKKKEDDLAEIMALTNPIVRQKLLDEFADSADAAAVHLKAAKMPRQATKVLLPMNSMRPDEVYAPDFENGEKVVLVRHPHGGPFEIPSLTVNNNNRTAKRILGGAKDAVGIHFSVAEQLSGADFDGDTVLVIPNNEGKVKYRPPLAELKNFDAKSQYRIADDDTKTPRMSKQNTQTEMGRISNLITDMTIRGASEAELANAVRHSMVVIDAEKHGLDYKRSEKDHNIASLRKEYQPYGGASTLISRASSDARVPERKYLSGKRGVDPETGERVYVNTGNSYEKTTTKVNKRTGEVTTKTETVQKTTKGTAMEFAKDAFDLSSGTPMEEVYASYANSMKALANRARKESVAIESPRQSKSAKELYKKEVADLDAKLKLAQRNAPLERRAQVLGGAMAKQRIAANPLLDKDDIKKITYQSLNEAREITGANKLKVNITDREWTAIQAGAVSSTRLKEILANADMDRVKELATPRSRSSLTPGQMARAKQLRSSGRSLTEIADALGIPRSTVADNLSSD